MHSNMMALQHSGSSSRFHLFYAIIALRKERQVDKKGAYRAGYCIFAGAAFEEAVLVTRAVGCYRAARGALTSNEALREAQHWCPVCSSTLFMHKIGHPEPPHHDVTLRFSRPEFIHQHKWDLRPSTS